MNRDLFLFHVTPGLWQISKSGSSPSAWAVLYVGVRSVNSRLFHELKIRDGVSIAAGEAAFAQAVVRFNPRSTQSQIIRPDIEG